MMAESDLCISSILRRCKLLEWHKCHVNNPYWLHNRVIFASKIRESTLDRTLEMYSPSPAFNEAVSYLSSASSLAQVPNSVKLEVHTHIRLLAQLPDTAVTLGCLCPIALWHLHVAHRRT